MRILIDSLRLGVQLVLLAILLAFLPFIAGFVIGVLQCNRVFLCQSDAMTRPSLSKSRVQAGRQCHKRLWLELHQPALATWDEADRARLDEGTRFGELARELLGNGQLIDVPYFEPRTALDQTQAALTQPAELVPRVFEAAFEHEGVRIRADVLQRDEQGEALIEVKSSTEVKEPYLWDCAIQTWVARGAGRPVKTMSVGHVDNTFVYEREGDYRGLLKQADITAEVEALLPTVPVIVAELKQVAGGPMPEIRTGAHCREPYDCPFVSHCRSSEPAAPEYPVEDNLPRAKALIERLHEAGYRDLREVPLELLDRPIHQRIAQAVHSGVPFVSPALASTLDAIPYPRYYLDFETIAFAIPRWLGTRPYQQLPFQFSCHREESDGTLTHRAFLDLSGASPLPGFVEALLDSTGDAGPILVWNQGFEAARLRELARLFPDCADALLGLVARMVDLLPIYREHYYHPAMSGSWSIKAVLPTIAPDLDYGQLEIGDGGSAQLAYLAAIAPTITDTKRDTLRTHLLAYCERDTFAMVRLARWRHSSA